MECLVILAMGLYFAAPPIEEVRQAAADVYRDADIQARFPQGDKAVVRRPQAEREPDSDRPKGADPAGAAVNTLMWVLVFAAAVMAALYLAQRLGGYTADIEAHGGAAAATSSARAPPPADEARRLAAEGRYEEAIHLLLLLALHPLAEEQHLAGSLTSREIIRSVDMPMQAREAIEGLSLAVEISVFGGQPPTRADFDACEAQFDRYCAALGVESA